MKIPPDNKHLDALTFQSYAPQEEIEGVFHLPLNKHRSLDGDFMEVLRITDGAVEGLGRPFEARQVSISNAAAGRINAFHLHPKVVQDECWCVVAGVMRVWLVDVRDGSPTLGVKRRYVLSGEQPAWLHIPAGVAHGYRAGAAGATLLYVMNNQFDPADPNEGRLPWDHFGAALWEDDRG